jgi:magnesium-transporting ATPase (P-type)
MHAPINSHISSSWKLSSANLSVDQPCLHACIWCATPTAVTLCRFQVSEGSGRILVVATGTHSEWGKTMALVGSAGSEDTPLQEKLADLAGAIGKIGFFVALACFVALLIKW